MQNAGKSIVKHGYVLQCFSCCGCQKKESIDHFYSYHVKKRGSIDYFYGYHIRIEEEALDLLERGRGF